MDHSLKSLPFLEIPKLILRASPFGGTVAQPSATDVVSQIKNLNLDESGALEIELREKLAIERERPLTVNLNYRDLSFYLESNQYHVEGLSVRSPLPKQARAIDRRENERYVLPFKEKVMMSNRRIEKRGGSTDFEAQVIDLSRGGFGIMVSSPDEDLLRANDHLWIRVLNGVPLKKPVFARVVYVFEKKFINGFDLRAGLELGDEIPEELFQELRMKCGLILKA